MTGSARSGADLPSITGANAALPGEEDTFIENLLGQSGQGLEQ